jgi:hypothetical protein
MAAGVSCDMILTFIPLHYSVNNAFPNREFDSIVDLISSLFFAPPLSFEKTRSLGPSAPPKIMVKCLTKTNSLVSSVNPLVFALAVDL